jgi:PKD repeat protein
MHRVFRGLALVLVLALAVGVHGVGRQLIVSKEGLGTYRSVQAALNDASAGDTILVNPGIYEETIEFVNGVTVIGSGADHTIIRYGYGFDEVLHAKNIVSGRIERVTLERMASVLDAPVVVLESAAMTFAECVITGGRPEGVRVSGLSGRATFVDCEVTGNAQVGILCDSGAEIGFDGGTVRENGAAGIRVADGDVRLDRATIESNGAAGLVLEGDSRANCVATSIYDHDGWGIEATGTSVLDLIDGTFEDNGAGGLRLLGSTAADVSGCRFDGGEEGIAAGGTASIEIEGGTIRGATDVGLRISGAADARAEWLELIENAGHGCELASSGSIEIRHATIARNAGDGVIASGSAVAVTESIVALNDGAGLRVPPDSSASSPPTFGYNAVWGNAGGDYVGVARRSSDVSGYPEFVDPQAEDFSLRLDSPCIGAGERGATIGAHVDPNRDAGTTAIVSVRRSIDVWGIDLVGEMRLTTSDRPLEEVRLRASRQWEQMAVEIESSFLGVGSEWLRVGGSICPIDTELIGQAGPILARVTIGGERRFDGIGSRSSIRTSGEIISAAASLRTSLDWERPGASHQEVALSLGQASLAAAATDLTLTALDASLAGEQAGDAGTAAWTIGLGMLPELRITAEAQWGTSTWSLAARVRAYAEDLTSGDLRLVWTDDARGARIEVTAELAERVLRDVAVRAEVRLGDLAIESEVGVHETLGVRLQLSIDLDTARWLVPRPNRAPMPAFEIAPDEPEAGEPIVFDASDSSDPDGTIVETWWAFGDGQVDLGNPVSHRFETAGSYEVALTVADDDGDTATLVRTVTVLEAATTPVASFTWEPVSELGTALMRPLRAGDRVRLDAGSSYDPDGKIVEYAWDLESDGVFDVVTADSRATIEPLAAGTWPVTLRVLDDAGHTDAIMRVLQVEEPKPPNAAFDVSPSKPSIFDPVRFIDRSVGMDGEIVTWEWSLGDGHVSRDPEPVHRYEAAGRYEIRLTVTDSLGLRSTQTSSLVVERSPGVVPVTGVWALVIGISDYEEVEDLPYARRDAEAVVEWLLGNGVPMERIRLLTDGATAENGGPVAAPATLVNVREALGWLRRVASEDDLVLIHFSGHGYQGADDGADETDGVDEFFVLHDTRAAAKDDTALRDDEFGRFLDRIASNHVLIFFDSCYSGGLSRSLPPGRRAAGDDADWFGDLRLEGRLLLAASSEGEEAFESPDLEHGVFTHFVLEGLAGEADLNGDYHVTIWELYEYVAERVPDFVDAERGEPQHPQLLGEGETRIVLALKDRPLEAAFSYCPAVPYVGGPVVFTDQSSGQGIVERAWRFGDGAERTGDRVEHVYAEDGTYEVVLVVDGDAGDKAEARLDVRVAPIGRIVGVDEARTAIVSLGLRNGLHVGDRFATEQAPDVPALEVLELIDEDRATCRVFEGADVHTNDAVVPIDAARCDRAD